MTIVIKMTAQEVESRNGHFEGLKPIIEYQSSDSWIRRMSCGAKVRRRFAFPTRLFLWALRLLWDTACNLDKVFRSRKRRSHT